MYQLELKALAETEKFALRFINWTLPIVKSQGLSIALEGELGSGKTTFVAALAKVLKSKDAVSSPTYVLQQEYRSNDEIYIQHWDLYRLPKDAVPEELFETVKSKEIRLIEWASRSNELYKKLDMEIVFSIVSEDTRKCRFSFINSKIENLLGSWPE